MKARIKRRRLFHPRAEINFVHLAGCQLPSTDWAHFNENATFRFTFLPDRLTVTKDARHSPICFCVFWPDNGHVHTPYLYIYILFYFHRHARLSNNFQRLLRKVVFKDARMSRFLLEVSDAARTSAERRYHGIGVSTILEVQRESWSFEFFPHLRVASLVETIWSSSISFGIYFTLVTEKFGNRVIHF